MILTTPRLTLRPQEQTDSPALFALLRDPETMRFWNRPAITKLAVVEELVREQQAAMARGLCRYWSAFAGDDAIGSLDLSLIEGARAQLGFVLARDHWGQGLASEAVAAVIACGFARLNLTRLTAIIQHGNDRAARVVEKNGFSLREIRAMALPGGTRRDCAFYSLER